MKKKILVLCGGRGSEREVSLMSGRNVYENIPRDKYNVVLVEIGRDERWGIIDIDSPASTSASLGGSLRPNG